MVSIEAAQLIFSNVEKEQSPGGKSGFQTLFHTQSDLSDTEIEQIEARLLYFRSEIEPVKRLYFVTDTLKYVIAEITPLTETDRLGRKGRYMAHAFILNKDEFQKMQSNPFHIFRNTVFIKTVEDALQAGDFNSGNIPRITLSVNPDLTNENELLKNWPKRDLQTLFWLALRARRYPLKRKTVVFIGEPSDVEQAMETALTGVPVPLRHYCTFDSYFYKGNIVATHFWGIGLMESPRNPNFVNVDAGNKRVPGNISQQPEFSYEQWLLAMFQQDKPETITQYRESAFVLGEWLDEHTKTGFNPAAFPDEFPDDLIHSFVTACSSKIKTRILDSLKYDVPEKIAAKLVDPLYDNTEPIDTINGIQDGFESGYLLETLYNVYVANRFRKPSKKELRSLIRLLKKNNYPLLQFLLLTWKKKIRLLEQLLEDIDEDIYTMFLRDALKYDLGDPLFYLVPSKCEIFVELFLATTPPEKFQWTDLVKTFVVFKRTGLLERFADSVERWSPKHIFKTHAYIDALDDIPETFRNEVNQRFLELSAKTMMGKFKRSYNKLFRKK